MSPRRAVATVLFELVLLAYPRAFRRRFGDEMRADCLREPHPRAAVFLGLLRHGLAERGAALARWSTWPNHRHHLYLSEGSRSMVWDSIRLDVRHTLRLARQSPGPALLAVLALAMGIGANTAVFTVVRGVLLRPLPYAEPDRLAVVWSRNGGGAHAPMSPADFRDLEEQAGPFTDVEAYFSFIGNAALTIDGRAEVIATTSVTGGLFPLLGRTAALGRTLIPGDGEDRMVLSHGFWRRRFGADPQVVGRTVLLDARPVTIVGVMPEDFAFPYKGLLGPTGFTRTLAAEAWMPLSFAAPPLRGPSGGLARNARFLGVLGRLRPGATVEQAQGTIAAIARRIEEANPDTNRGWTFDVVSAHEQIVGGARPALLLLLAAAAIVLLMACINVANMVLARSVARQRELAVRAALGAGRWRLAGQALVEGLVLSAAGAGVGLLCLSWGIRALVALAPADIPRLQEATPDLAVLAVALLVTVFSGTLVALGPAVAAGGADIVRALRHAGRGTAAPAGHRSHAALAIAEIALAVVLTIASALLMRSFGRIVGVDPGFDGEHVLTLQMNLPDRIDTPDARRAFYASFFERIAALPGVAAVGGTTRIPLGSTNVSTFVEVEGRAVAPASRPEVEFRRAMHDYFATMGIPIVRGRGFTAADGPSAPAVAIVNQALVRRVFAGEEPIGRRVRLGPSPSAAWITIVGVAGDVRHSSLEAEPAPEVYINYLQNPPVAPFIVIRANGDPALLAGDVRAAARALEPALPLYDVRTMNEIRSASVAPRRFLLTLIAVFSALALTLAGVGVYGVMSLMVSERRHEMGVRLALGATPRGLVGMVLRGALMVALAGVAIGVAAAAALTPVMRNQLFGVSEHDPATFLLAPAVLLGVAIVASLVPARKVMGIDPMQVLRAD